MYQLFFFSEPRRMRATVNESSNQCRRIVTKKAKKNLVTSNNLYFAGDLTRAVGPVGRSAPIIFKTAETL